MSIQDTPVKVRNSVDYAIELFNSRWDLQLPRRHGDDSEHASELAKACYSGIRHNCFHQSFDVTELLERFNSRVNQWVPKPFQEKGTLPSFPITKFSARPDAISKPGRVRILPPQHREDLLTILLTLLRDEKPLPQTSCPSHARSASHSSRDTSAPYTTAPDGRSTVSAQPLISDRSMSKKKSGSARKAAKPQSPTRSTKRSSSAAENEAPGTPKRITRTGSIKDHFLPVPWPMSAPRTQGEIALAHTSFQSSRSPVPTEIFTPPLDHGNATSNDTSLISLEDSDNNESQDYFPTQEVMDIFQDPSFRKSFQDLDPPPSDSRVIEEMKIVDQARIEELETHGPFCPPQSQLPLNVSFRYRYELERFAEPLGKTATQLFMAIERRYPRSQPSYDQVWEVVKHIAKQEGKAMPSRTPQKAWQASENTFEDAETHRTVLLSGHVDWANSGSKGLFKFKLNPFKLDKSCRLHRRFGADRFIVLTMPFFARRQTPREIREKYPNIENLHHSICTWLSQSTHHIAGRKWRTYFLEAEKAKKKTQNDVGPKLKVHLFAVDGVDFRLGPAGISHTANWREEGKHRPLGIDALSYWHLRIQYNLCSGCTDLKMFSRFSLGLSKTTSTVILEGHEFLRLEDVKGKPVMNDGCAMMSLELAKSIARCIGIKDDDSLPSAFQGRIGGAKGLWMVDYHDTFPGVGKRKYWIQVSDSQLKIKPHPSELPSADPEQRTFEVLKYSTPAKPAYLNPQLLHILDYHKVPRIVFRDALLEDVREYSDSLFSAMGSSYKLRLWLQQNHKAQRGIDPIKLLGSFPNSKEERINILLESGFLPNECAILNELLRSILTDQMNRYVEKLHIKIPNSTSVFCVADPYGVLEEGEIYLGLSGLWKNPVTGLSENGINNVNVLVARNPAHLPSDIQKVRAVFKEQLRHFRDVAVFSSKGEIPLAHKLSGGDYDGDTVWVCWEQSFLENFENAAFPRNPPTLEDCYLVKNARPISKVFDSSTISPAAVNKFLNRCVAFNAQSSLLGMCTLEHEKVIYHGKAKLSSENAMRLAALAGFLVDAPKQGYLLTDSAWHRLRVEVSGKIALAQPAYRGSEAPRTGVFENVIDWLKFGVAEDEKETVLGEFSTQWPQLPVHDRDLTQLWKRARARADVKPANLRSMAFKIILDDLEQNVKKIGARYLKEVQTTAGDKASFEFDGNPFTTLIVSLHDDMLGIQPAKADHDMYDQYLQEQNEVKSEERREKSKLQQTQWTALRASCAYHYLHKMGRLVWLVAGIDLCKTKADMSGSTRTMTAGLHNLLKLDSKLTDRVTSMAEEAENADDDFSIEDDGQNLMESWVA